jgi:putative transposase
MIAATHQEHAALSLRRLCTLFGVGRTWYYTHPSAETVAARDTALRHAVERTVLDFPGYGYRRVTAGR